jgi:hypothetical protein
MSALSDTLSVSVCRVQWHNKTMKILDESIEEIDEALAHLSDGVRKAEDFRKQYLLDLIDQMLDAKLELIK